MARYRRLEPPDYYLKNITVPLGIFYSYGDNLVYAKVRKIYIIKSIQKLHKIATPSHLLI